jgi:hypothetical protein
MLIDSTTALDQSIRASSPSRSKVASCSRSQNPVVVHWLNRRWAVARVTPNNASGSFHQEQPAWVTYTIAARTARSLTRRRLPPCRRTGAGGINGSAISHRSSGAHVRIMASFTNPDHAAGQPTSNETRTKQCTKFLSAAANDRLYAAWVLVVVMRRGELAGLKRPKLDLESGVIYVHWQRAVASGEVEGGVIEKEPKGKSKRTAARKPCPR